MLAEYIWLDGTPLGFVQSGQTYHVHVDHLGTPKALTDASGQVVWKADYSPFGKATITSQGPTFNLRFPGQYYDAETGLHYNWHRYYDPALGRYLQSDRLGLFDGVDTYGYVRANPLRLIDPTGEYGLAGAAYGLISGGIGGYISGGWQGALAGAGTGALVGFVNIFGAHSAGAAAGAGIASLLGQSAGLYVSGKDVTDYCNYDFSAVAGAALGGALGGPLGSTIGRYISPYRFTIIGRPLSSSGINKIPGNTVGSVVEGVTVGSGELFGKGF
ncbi:hypothetical protein OIPHN330_58550 (plasmid) [Citrobacter freundii]|nr:hypothetical protein TMSI_53700 [Klebsiella quasipneumoniae]BBM27954.1 Rhs family protein [Enterobacter hormaechei subsp. hoffmannii]BEJ37235.1 hypothetical protein OIPHN330_58550 [Citrobacter freundii]BEJ43195.1 hypothetical protein OIPHN354_59070 [Citrobacter freundii]